MDETLRQQTSTIDLETADRIGVRVALQAMITNLRRERSSRECALAITKLQEALFWLVEESAQS